MLLLDFEQAEASKLRNDMRGIIRLWCAMTMALVVSPGAVAGENDVWSVGKSSGEVWIATRDAQQVSLKPDENLKPGDTIRTGRNGRVLLVRGEETILIAPNSVVGLPLEKKDGLSTTILQQAGSILLEVEKRNVKHFEVETPLPGRSSQRNAVQRRRGSDRHARRCAQGTGRSIRFQIRSDRAGDAGPNRDKFRAW